MITIIDYGLGNLKNIEKTIQTLGHEVQITSKYSEIKASQLIILPGVGAFETAIKNLTKCGLNNFLKDYILAKKPFLGICLGFQLLFQFSEENGGQEGLNIFPGKVKLFQTKNIKVPHMGWNTVEIQNDKLNLFQKQNKDYFYFVHSYYVAETLPDLVASTTNYGIEFISSIEQENLFASQFHPEKSGAKGLILLKNFLKNIK